ncbi:MAG: SIMPL domain-containing protein [Pseudomonadota bacterium]
MKVKLVIMSLLFAVTQVACAQELNEGAATEDTISVIGVGEVEVEFDKATLQLQISAEAKQLSQAKQKADQEYETFLATLKSLNISTNSLGLNQLNMNPVYTWRNANGTNERIQTGFAVSRSLRLDVEDLEVLPSLLEKLASQNLIEVQNIARGVQDSSIANEAALSMAASDARKRGEFLAAQFGRKLGEVKSIKEQGVQSPVSPIPYAAGMRAASADLPAEHLGSTTVRASVHVIFRLR